METLTDYFNHYVKSAEGIYFLAVTLTTLIAIIALIYGYTLILAGNRRGRERRQYIFYRFNSITERFYELIFSGGSILLFMAVYYLIERFFTIQPYRGIWDKYRDFLMLLLIVISILINRLIDNCLINLKYLSHDDKTSVRLIGMLYMFLIFGYIKFIYENNSYDMLISYFLGLMIGRFVYFDVSLNDLLDAAKSSVRNLPLMCIALAYLGLLSWYGFSSGYLIKHIGVLTNVFFIHVFITVAIFVIFHVYHIVGRDRSKR